VTLVVPGTGQELSTSPPPIPPGTFSQITVYFSEDVVPAEATNPNNYRLFAAMARR